MRLQTFHRGCSQEPRTQRVKEAGLGRAHVGWHVVGPEASAESLSWALKLGHSTEARRPGTYTRHAPAASPDCPRKGIILGNTAVSKGGLSCSHQPLPPPGCTGRLVLCCCVTVCLKMTMVINYLTAPVGQEFGCGLAGWLWHGVSHEAAIKTSCWGHPKARLGLQDPLRRWPPHRAVAGPQCLSLWSVTPGGKAHQEQFGATSLREGNSQSWGASAYHRAAPT